MRWTSIPRSIVPLLILLAAALIWLLVLQLGHGVDLDAGASLAPFPGTELASLELRAQGRSLVLRHEPAGWRLEGVVADLADSVRAEALAAAVCSEFTGPVLPGSQEAVNSVEYGLAGAVVLRLQLADRDGNSVSVALGVRNPVNGRVYAAGAGRSGVFTVSPELIQQLDGLPDSVRLFTLWPTFARAEVETLDIAHSGLGSADLFVRRDGGWWLREPEDGLRRLGIVAPEYERIYGDRRVELDGVAWWRASERAIVNLIHLLSLTQVRAFGPSPAPPESLRAAGLDPPTVAVRLDGPSVGPAQQATFGGPRGRGAMAATRAGLPNLLAVSEDARELLLAPLVEFVNADALPFAPALADSFVLETSDQPALHIRRGAGGWEVERPGGAAGGPAAQSPGDVADSDLIADLIYHLDHLQIQWPLPPQPDTQPFRGGYVVTMRFWLPDESVTTPREVQCGRLDQSGAVGFWYPADGRLLRVRSDILNTLRSLCFALQVPAR
jgi:hypothetical protein